MKRIVFVLPLLLAVPARGADVFLTVTREALPVTDAPSNIEVIKAADIDRTTAKTVADAIETLPGVVIRKSGSLGSSELPSVRGFSSQQVLVVIDDTPQIPDLTGTVDLSRIPLDNVDRIEVLRGGASAVYGPNAEGGVIHIITKKPAAGIEARLDSEVGSYGTYHDRALAGLSQGPVQAQVTASRDLSDGFQQNSDYRNTNLTGLLSYDAGDYGKLSYNAEGEKGTLGLPSGTPVPIGKWNGERERQANDSQARQRETDLNNRVAYSNRVAGMDLKTRIANNVTDRDTFQFGSDTLIRTEGRNAFAMLDTHEIGSLGYEYYQRRLDSNVYGIHRANAWGTFYEDELHAGDRVSLTPGVRYDRDNDYGESWSPRLLIVLRPSDFWKVSASADRSFQAPTFADLYNPFVPAQYQNQTLNPEITWSYDAGITLHPLLGLEATVTLYRADTRDRIALDPNKGFAAFNLDRAYTQGLESEIAYARDRLKQRLNWTYLQAEGLSGGRNYRPLAFSPKHTLNYRADLSLPWRTIATANARYVHRQWTGIGETGVQIPGYTVVSIKVTKRFWLAEAFVAVDNLLDRHYAETADAFNGYFPQPGRTYSGGMSIRFLK